MVCSDERRRRMIAKIESTCYNSEDPVTLNDFKDLPNAKLFRAVRATSGPKYECYEYDTFATLLLSPNPTHPRTRELISKHDIRAFYKRHVRHHIVSGKTMVLHNHETTLHLKTTCRSVVITTAAQGRVVDTIELTTQTPDPAFDCTLATWSNVPVINSNDAAISVAADMVFLFMIGRLLSKSEPSGDYTMSICACPLEIQTKTNPYIVTDYPSLTRDVTHLCD